MNELYINALNFININNTSNNLPYHSIDHLWKVYKYCDIFSKYYTNINKTELLIAGLFHDYDHSGGKLTDDLNILNAIEGVTSFYNENPEFDLDIVKYIIKCTQYPYVISDDELTNEGKIIRDADTSYLLEDISIVKLYSGLRTEFNQTLEVFLNNQFKFIDNLKFYTPEIENIWNNGIKNKRLFELNLLKKYV